MKSATIWIEDFAALNSKYDDKIILLLHNYYQSTTMKSQSYFSNKFKAILAMTIPLVVEGLGLKMIL